MAYISRALRQLVTERAGGLCEYCYTAQAIVIEMEIDHIVPEVAGGVTPHCVSHHFPLHCAQRLAALMDSSPAPA